MCVINNLFEIFIIIYGLLYHDSLIIQMNFEKSQNFFSEEAAFILNGGKKDP